jgi:hypothetical protein
MPKRALKKTFVKGEMKKMDDLLGMYFVEEGGVWGLSL